MFSYLCKKCKNNKIYNQLKFEELASNSNFEELNNIKDYCSNIDLEKCLEIAVQSKNVSTADFFIKQGAENIDFCLKIASENNMYEMVKLLIKNGGKTTIGLRYSKSPNIIKMIYEFEENNKN